MFYRLFGQWEFTENLMNQVRYTKKEVLYEANKNYLRSAIDDAGGYGRGLYN
jgi:hypothetical protein